MNCTSLKLKRGCRRQEGGAGVGKVLSPLVKNQTNKIKIKGHINNDTAHGTYMFQFWGEINIWGGSWEEEWGNSGQSHREHESMISKPLVRCIDGGLTVMSKILSQNLLFLIWAYRWETKTSYLVLESTGYCYCSSSALQGTEIELHGAIALRNAPHSILCPSLSFKQSFFFA